MINLKFFGAVGGNVTGSSHLLTVNDKKVLLDCGLHQGRRMESFELNKEFKFQPAELDDVILSHAHIDHSGKLPALVREGFSGNIFSTFATKDLCTYMLADSAHIQKLDIQFIKKYIKKGEMETDVPLEVLYNDHDVQDTMHHFMTLDFHREFYVNKYVRAEFLIAGHILGSALTRLTINDGKKEVKLGFTGDLGRKGLPILRDPEQFTNIDYLICESTYGDRTHDDIKHARKELETVINRTVNRGGKIIIPAFAVERTQELIYQLNVLTRENRIPPIDIFVDSPLAVNVTTVFRMHPENYDDETWEEICFKCDPFGFESLQYITETDDSKALNYRKGSCVIISASGMCEAGRIRHHLSNNIENPNNTVLIVGFMAKNTLGRKLVDREPKIKIFGRTHDLKAEVCVLNTFSAHADKNELFHFVKECGSRLKKVFLVHGEDDQRDPFADRIKKELGLKVACPNYYEEIPLN